MPHRIDIISGLNPNIQNNFLCCQGCQTVVCTFQNVHNTSLTILDFQNSGATTGFTFTVTEINGGAVTWGFVVGIGDTFTLTLDVCYSEIIPGNYFQATFVTDEHGPDSAFNFNFLCFTLYDLGVPPTMDFGLVPASSTQSQNVFITNNTIGSVIIDDITTMCGPGVVITPTTSTIPVGATIPFLITWNAGAYPDNISCQVDFDSATPCTTPMLLTGATEDLDCDAGDSICCLDVTIKTENGYLDDYTNLCDGTNVYKSAAILEKKQIIYYLKYFDVISNGTTFYFNTAQYIAGGNVYSAQITSNTPPPTNYTFTYNSSLITGTQYTMNLVNAGAAANSERNIQAYITFLDPATGKFKITLDFFVVCDRNYLLNNSVFSNKDKYQKSNTTNPFIYNNTTPSVFTQDEFLQSCLFIQKLTNKVSFVHSQYFTARFYNSGLYAGISEFTSPMFTLSRAIGTVPNFSTFEQTKITFTINVGSVYGGAAYVVFHLIDESLSDNTQVFLTATDSSRSLIDNVPTAGVLNNHLLSPSTFTYLGSDVYEATCYVNTDLNPSHQYRVFAIVYGGDGVTVNTFKSEQSYYVRQVPEYDCDCQPEITSYWDNYFETLQTNDYRPVGMERIQHRLTLTGGAIQTCLDNWGLPITDWRQALTKVNLRIYKRQLYFPADPNTDYATFFEFGNYTSTRNNAAIGNWDNLTDLDVLDTNVDEIDIRISDVRVRWEVSDFNGNVSQCKMDTYMDKYPITGVTASNYINSLNIINSWIDDNIYFEYEFVFDLSAYFPQQFKFSICKAFMVRAISFENINSGFPDHIISVDVQGFDPNINAYVNITGNNINALNYTWLKLIYTSNDVAPDFSWFNFFIQTYPFGLPTLIESNPTASPNSLTNYGLAPIVNAESIYYSTTNQQAEVILDTSLLQNTNYIFCGYWTPRTEYIACTWTNLHNRVGGSSSIQLLPDPTYGDYLQLSLFSVVLNRYVYLSSTFGGTPPSAGTTYKMFYSFSIPTTRLINIWLGQASFAGLPDIIIPIGAQVGSFTIVWPNGSPYWTIQLLNGTDVSGYWAFAIGTEDCDTPPFD